MLAVYRILPTWGDAGKRTRDPNLRILQGWILQVRILQGRILQGVQSADNRSREYSKASLYSVHNQYITQADIWSHQDQDGHFKSESPARTRRQAAPITCPSQRRSTNLQLKTSSHSSRSSHRPTNTTAKKSFSQHLFNVYSFLKSQSLPDEVCDAGLFHSIYGTEFYHFQSAGITRDVVRGYVGEYAEELAYILSSAVSGRIASAPSSTICRAGASNSTWICVV